jgi:carbamate kinase
MATKAKRIEDMSEEELMQKSGAAYDKVMPSPEPGEQKPKKLAKGGSASARADGCACRGKTKGKMY